MLIISINIDTVTVNDQQQLQDIEFGYPVHLIAQNQSNRVGVGGGGLTYPIEARFLSDIWNYPISLFWTNIIAQLLIVEVMLYGFYMILKKWYK
jgi:hypothetical protein